MADHIYAVEAEIVAKQAFIDWLHTQSKDEPRSSGEFVIDRLRGAGFRLVRG